MNKYGLVGKKLGHSLSPIIHNYVFKSLKIDGEYSLYEIEDSKNILEIMLKEGIKGFNVTIPYKESIIEHLDYISEEAKKIGAVNLVKIENGRSYGYNSDYFGVIEMLKKSEVQVKNKVCYVLGSGGASKSVIVALSDLKAKEIIVVTRDVEKKKEELENKFKDIKVVSYDEIGMGDIIINTTPLGMYPNIDSTPVNKDILKNFNVAVDVVYNPKVTKFLKEAEEIGLKCVDGITMLIAQAIKSDELWEGIKIDNSIEDRIEKILLERLK